ncbi:aminoglycoside phosphotransferase family protein [Bradyrhizobium ontarionense]|uniref:Aminoglycoside phosphotransferase family protein n=1 Tax=Bradyrhizobium ontarionense TaxID=2898149 RepID=A0ABY3RBG4_9BRAD|nr:aminoglycoside phosphotransferase family protein [Bradyrhizobium sp. A19]UFZ04412.1 aminoglycoside phosphotransferase family protein [Bradyrhizobium sp. A19]
MTAADASPDADAALLALAQRLTAQAGKATPQALTRLAGGRNNQVFRLDTEAGPLVLKRYFTDARDSRDRLGAEWSFISHAWSRGVHVVPEPLACDRAEQAGLYSFVQGRKLGATELAPVHVDAAIDFVLAVNAPPRPALAPGSEACFSLTEHIATVERRVARLATLDGEVPHVAEARQLVAARLQPAWEAVKADILRGAAAEGLALDAAIPGDQVCLSPSDFGFHNALIDETGKLTFLDFEYAGRDDPAKLVSDFFCQPEVPVPLAMHEHFIERLTEGLGLDAASVTRCHLLLDAYQIKWTCIILNDFLPLGATRRAFADTGAWAQRCAEQLAKADAKLGLVGATSD